MSKAKRILIVDDQYGIRALLTLALEKYSTKEAANGQQALEIAENWKPHLMIVDMKMPILNGVDTITSLKQMELESTKVLLMTAYDNTYLVDDPYIAGFISKPFDLDKLISIVAELLGE